jgi:hypothetical protein
VQPTIRQISARSLQNKKAHLTLNSTPRPIKPDISCGRKNVQLNIESNFYSRLDFYLSIDWARRDLSNGISLDLVACLLNLELTVTFFQSSITLNFSRLKKFWVHFRKIQPELPRYRPIHLYRSKVGSHFGGGQKCPEFWKFVLFIAPSKITFLVFFFWPTELPCPIVQYIKNLS